MEKQQLESSKHSIDSMPHVVPLDPLERIRLDVATPDNRSVLLDVVISIDRRHRNAVTRKLSETVRSTPKPSKAGI